MKRRDKHNIVEQSSFNKKFFLNKNKNVILKKKKKLSDIRSGT